MCLIHFVNVVVTFDFVMQAFREILSFLFSSDFKCSVFNSFSSFLAEPPSQVIHATYFLSGIF